MLYSVAEAETPVRAKHDRCSLCFARQHVQPKSHNLIFSTAHVTLDVNRTSNNDYYTSIQLARTTSKIKSSVQAVYPAVPPTLREAHISSSTDACCVHGCLPTRSNKTGPLPTIGHR